MMRIRAGFWAFEHLYPEGPLMPLRIGDQPYGLLPVTALGQWEASESRDAEGAAQRQVEMAMARTLNELRGQWAGAARPTRSVVGKIHRPVHGAARPGRAQPSATSRASSRPPGRRLPLIGWTPAQQQEFNGPCVARLPRSQQAAGT